MKIKKIIYTFLLIIVSAICMNTTVHAGWSEWNIQKPEGNYVVEDKTQYRYQEKKVLRATSLPATPSGYTYYSSANTGTYTSWGSWSGYSTTARTTSTLMDVQTCTGYRYYAFRCRNCGTQDPYSGACSNCGGSVYWVEEWGTCSGYAYSAGYQKVDSNKGRINWLNGKWWYFELNGKSNGQGGTGQPTTKLYRYRTRQQYVDYTYWMSNYTEWSFDSVTSSSSKKVETRTVYRYKTGLSQKITASSKKLVYNTDAVKLNAKASTGGKLTYKSSNKEIATVSSGGKVTPKGYGKTTITITAPANGSYKKATKQITITVVPQKVTWNYAKSEKKGQIKFSWKKNSTITGYECMISRTSDFSNNTNKKTFTKSVSLPKTFSASSGKTYYIKVRAYKTVNGNKYYGAWSTVKKVKVK